MTAWLFFLYLLGSGMFTPPEPPLTNDRFSLQKKGTDQFVLTLVANKQSATFAGRFRVFYRTDNPSMALRPAGIPNVQYNVLTWKSASAKGALQTVKRNDQQQGDGFDDRILSAQAETRTANVFQSAQSAVLVPIRVTPKARGWQLVFADQEGYSLSAELTLANGQTYPQLSVTLTPKKGGYFSVAYEGAPAFSLAQVSDLWQPMIWQEKRFPEQSYLTTAFQCPLPTTLASVNGSTVGVVAHPDEFPFQPLPLLDNSRFGVALRNKDGQVQPQLFAPVLGGIQSERKPGDRFTFKQYLFLGAGTCQDAFAQIAHDLYDFRDYRSNAGVGSLNRTIENMTAYGMSQYSWFVDSLKGCAYSTDVPGAVKNVSALNPFEIALITDRSDIYQQRAYPILEFLLSREKFLFSLDPKQKIQHPSRAMLGPVAPISELSALYAISGQQSSVLFQLAEQEFQRSRARNLEKLEQGDRWQNALALYRANGQKTYLDKAIAGAEQYLAERVKRPMTDFNESGAEYFFWTGFTPDWINLFQLYEATGQARFLEAARQGARQYAMFVWFAPRIPQQSVLVNAGGKAPVYWYLASKGHTPMQAPEEQVPAWRLSEIGLTPESSGTCSGHRGIFMTNYAPWMLRIGYQSHDTFLQEIARSAVVGRYANFPGYHINTARTTIYEKPDYPLHPFKELSVNSFHFNHIWPHISLLVDYLLSDTYVRSAGKINFPAEFIESYAYLQSKFYGHQSGEFYGEKNVWLWMPEQLIRSSSEELNYVSAYGNGNVYLAFTNQSNQPAESVITLNTSKLPIDPARTYTVEVWANNRKTSAQALKGNQLSIQVAPKGITAFIIRNVQVQPAFQRDFTKHVGKGWQTDYATDESTGFRTMLINFGEKHKTIYAYSVFDEKRVRKATFTYQSTASAQPVTLTDTTYPYEFTIPVSALTKPFPFTITTEDPDGKTHTSQLLTLAP